MNEDSQPHQRWPSAPTAGPSVPTSRIKWQGSLQREIASHHDPKNRSHPLHMDRSSDGHFTGGSGISPNWKFWISTMVMKHGTLRCSMFRETDITGNHNFAIVLIFSWRLVISHSIHNKCFIMVHDNTVIHDPVMDVSRRRQSSQISCYQFALWRTNVRIETACVMVKIGIQMCTGYGL